MGKDKSKDKSTKTPSKSSKSSTASTAPSITASSTPSLTVTEAGFIESKVRVSIHLHPSRLSNVKAGVEEQLNKLLMTYNEDLGGIVLSYSDITLSQSSNDSALGLGSIFQERPYIHFYVEARFVVYSLQKGQLAQGTVNQVHNDFINVLLLNVFSVNIPIRNLPKTLQFQEEQKRWIDTTIYNAAEEEAQQAAMTDSNAVNDGNNEATVKTEDASDEDNTAPSNTTTTPAKKLTKKELKKLERKKLRQSMLAGMGINSANATNSDGTAASTTTRAPVKGVITYGVVLRFRVESLHVRSDFFSLTGSLLPATSTTSSSTSSSSSSSSLPLGPTGVFYEGFTPALPASSPFEKALEGDLSQPPVTPAKKKGKQNQAKTPAAASSSSSSSSSSNNTALSAADQKKLEKAREKKEKMIARLRAKGILVDDDGKPIGEAAAQTSTSNNQNDDDDEDKPVTSIKQEDKKQKKRKADTDGDIEPPKKEKKEEKKKQKTS